MCYAMPDLSADIEAYAHYLNARPRAVEQFDAEALAEYDEDLDRARAAMERSWLESSVAL